MAELLMFAAIGGLCLGGAAFFGKCFEQCLPLSIFAIIIFCYGLGLAGALALAPAAVLGLSAMLAAAGFLYCRKAPGALLRRMFTPAFVLYALLCIFACLINRGKCLSGWDEFSHWGDAVKVMCQLNDFTTNPQSNALFPTYPPAMALWQYLGQKLSALVSGASVLNEGLLYTSYQWAMFALFMPFVSGLSLRRPLEALLNGLAVVLGCCIVFTDALSSIYIDAYLAILAGFLCAYGLFCARLDGLSLATLFAGAFVLTLCKDVGLLFALGGVAAFALCSRAQGLARDNRKKWALSVALMLLAVIAAQATWTLQCAQSREMQLSVKLANQFSVKELWAVINGSTQQPWRRTTLYSFLYEGVKPILRVQITDGYISYLAAFLLAALGFMAMYKRLVQEGEYAAGFRSMAAVCLLVAALYMAGLVISYMFQF